MHQSTSVKAIKRPYSLRKCGGEIKTVALAEGRVRTQHPAATTLSSSEIIRGRDHAEGMHHKVRGMLT